MRVHMQERVGIMAAPDMASKVAESSAGMLVKLREESR